MEDYIENYMTINEEQKQELGSLIVRLVSGEWNDAEEIELFRKIEEISKCPQDEIIDILFLSDDDDPESVISRMLNYKPNVIITPPPSSL